MLEEIDERGGNALPPVLAGDCEIIDIDLTTRLLKPLAERKAARAPTTASWSKAASAMNVLLRSKFPR